MRLPVSVLRLFRIALPLKSEWEKRNLTTFVAARAGYGPLYLFYPQMLPDKCYIDIQQVSAIIPRRKHDKSCSKELNREPTDHG
ncbi:MAG: hypothetical protein ACE5R6_00855 [Candidatus Heimdallarchaeota archaeon]